MKLIRKSLLVPDGLCIIVLQNKLWKPFMVYLFLKAYSNGHLKLNTTTLTFICNKFKISESTCRRSVRALIAMNWIGRNRNTGIYIINGFDVVRRIENIKRKQATWIRTQDLIQAKEFVICVAINNLIQNQITKKIRCAMDDRKKMGSYKSLRTDFYPISKESLKQIYGLSLTNASVFRRLAASTDWIVMKQNFEPIQRSYPKSLSVSNISLIRKAYDEHISKRIVIHKGIVSIQMPNLMKSNLLTKKRRMSI